MTKHVKWLRGELDGWVADGLIGQDHADAIRGRYPDPQPGLPWGTIIFSGLGAVIVGLGVILLLAYNWQAMPKAAKLGIVFAALAAAHGSGLSIFLRKRNPAVGESLCLLGTMLFGAGIWLVAQIYHIDEHFPNGLLLWALGALGMAWALPSIAHGMLAAVLIAVWAGVEAEEFSAPMHMAPAMTLVLLGGLAWRERSRALLAFVLPAFAVTVLINMGTMDDDLIAGGVLATAVLYMAASHLVRQSGRFTESAPVFSFFGWSGYVVMLYILSFPDVVRHVGPRWYVDEAAGTAYWVVLLVACVGAWLVVGVRAMHERHPRDRGGYWLHLVLPPLALVFYLISPFVIEAAGKWPAATVFNLVVLAHGTTLMARGCRAGDLRSTVLGSLLVGALVLARYFDLFHSLIVRGVVFVVVGAIIFAEGIVYTRARRQRTAEEDT